MPLVPQLREIAPRSPAKPAGLIALIEEADLKLSPSFLDFASRWLDGGNFVDQTWPDQTSELLGTHRAELQKKADFLFERLMLDRRGQELVDQVLQWFRSLSTGRTAQLRAFHKRVRFIVILGIARTGGSYLTSEIYRALGYRAESIPSVIAHDGFPYAQPFEIRRDHNSWIEALVSASQFLVMLELYFLSSGNPEPAFIPKKISKVAYASGLFRQLLGEDAEYWVTVRHPIASCISTYEKSGGLPPDGRFWTRSVIERWIQRDLSLIGIEKKAQAQMSYFDAYILYWERFYLDIAQSGITAKRRLQIVPYGADAMEGVSREFRRRFANSGDPSKFISAAGKLNRHPQWVARSEMALARVASVWKLHGLPWPEEELSLCF